MLKTLFNKFIFKKDKTKKCNFCNTNEHAKNPFIAGDSASICSYCVLSAHKILFGDVELEFTKENCDDAYDDEIDFLDSIRNKKEERESKDSVSIFKKHTNNISFH